MQQETFDFREPEEEPRRKKTIGERFEDMLRLQPDLYPQFKEIAHQLKNAGQMRYSSKAIIEICRYHRVIQGKDVDGWKINNVFTSRLSRKLIEECPEFDGWFELREIKTP